MGDLLKAEEELKRQYDCYKHCCHCGKVGCRRQDHPKKYPTRQASLLELKEEILQDAENLAEDIEKLLNTLSLLGEDTDGVKKHLGDPDKLKKAAKKLKNDHKDIPQYHRIASWNLHNLTNKTKHGTRYYEHRIESMCYTILYYQFHIIALQEMRQPQVAKDLCTSLNRRSCLRWQTEVPAKTMHEVPAFLYNDYVTLDEHNLPLNREDKYRIKPFSCSFKMHNQRQTRLHPRLRNSSDPIELINLHLRYTHIDQRKTELKQLPKLDTSSIAGVILIGDFNTHAINEDKKKPECERKLTEYFCTHPEGLKTNTKGDKAYDNLLCNFNLKGTHKYSSVGIIVAKHGMKENTVSDHRPTWADFEF